MVQGTVQNISGTASSSDIVADFVASTNYKDISKEAITVAKNALLDWLGITLIGSREPSIKILRQYIIDVGANKEATIICQKIKTSAELAALVNGTMSHALDYDDTIASTVRYNLHPSVTVFPAVLALAEKHRLSGSEVLTAYIVGMEVMYRVGDIIGSRVSQVGWHPTPILGTMGAVAASAKALKLNPKQVKMAIGVASSLAGGIHKNVGTMVKTMHAGNAARNGVIAATLASGGFTGDDNALEGREGFCQLFGGRSDGLVNSVGDLGKQWWLVSKGLGFKPYPACRIMHASIEASLYLREKFNIDFKQLSAVTCKASPFIRRLEVDRPRSGYEAKFSPEFCIAIALICGKVSLEQFTDEWVKDERVQQLMSKVTVLHPNGWTEAVVDHKTEITVRLENGAEHSHLVAFPKGEPENPMTDEELVNKFKDCGRLLLMEKDVVKIVDMVKNFEEINKLTELFKLLR